jgi:hypothetical protein
MLLCSHEGDEFSGIFSCGRGEQRYSIPGIKIPERVLA